MLLNPLSSILYAAATGDSADPGDGIVKWWDDVEKIGPEEFAKRANKTSGGIRFKLHTAARAVCTRTETSPSTAGANITNKLAWLETIIRGIARKMEWLAGSPETDHFILPRLTKRQLKQVCTEQQRW